MLRAVDMHPRQVRVSADVVRALIDTQFPQWRSLPITPVSGSGTMNAIFRLGDRLVARFPLQGDDPAEVLWHVESEASAAARLFGRTRFPTPQPVAIGRPGAGYELAWSVHTWLPGVTAIDRSPHDSVEFARDLADFITGLRGIPTEGKVFDGQGRGGILAVHDSWMQTCFQRSQGLLDVRPLRCMWSQMRELSRGPEPDLTSHGDLMPGNLLVSDDRHLTGILDVGSLGPADPALDLACAWHLLDTLPRKVLRESLNSDEAQWQRGRAWAFQQAMGLVWYYHHSNPTMSQIGKRTLRLLLTDPS
ncbi:aminoglycoside phosphotransferase family protein [Mycobacteroides abscessus]|uniref:aminoglycoside phosphotransferase family protein n=1 Tax=Mycobacteroides abscessus TaxID=36809 RepID=UPI0002682E2B|nr:aminoglycoside phosphotransferase family protein [Mycobacteroides abscessus]EIU17002.1 aminoglycoside phosphotransferase [Mycobacteroides abscessus 5S-0421]EIU17775.1 aminoglycoside phosphotransferase [Mycobacteroides abscessus 5S-0304]EIU18745.1 aminoglycoside phosphotransferase [Mycobacteroides abscessus 5S-0422]EIU18861.1 aminoglycoside phosphotransferase [Mycobacteroides abscessus 5S-0817]EIU26438.1 aminoglycoside phosphotransferase [Mycobacteroides abscessus 5S-0708]